MKSERLTDLRAFDDFLLTFEVKTFRKIYQDNTALHSF